MNKIISTTLIFILFFSNITISTQSIKNTDYYLLEETVTTHQEIKQNIPLIPTNYLGKINAEKNKYLTIAPVGEFVDQFCENGDGFYELHWTSEFL